MQYITDLHLAIIAIIPISAIPRAIFCAHKIYSDPDQRSLYEKRLKNLLFFVVLAECTLSLLRLAFFYFTGG